MISWFDKINGSFHLIFWFCKSSICIQILYDNETYIMKSFFTLFSNRQNVFKTHYCLKSAEKWKVFSHSSTLKLWAQNPQVCMCRKSLVWACMKTNWCFFNCEEQKFFERNICFSNAFSVFSLIIIAMVTKTQEKYLVVSVFLRFF